MTIDYIVASLPPLRFDEGGASEQSVLSKVELPEIELPEKWRALETEIRNTIAEERGGEKYKRPTTSCSIYWRNRVHAAFAEKNVLKREEALDRIWWDAAGELTPPSEPLGKGALWTYYLRLKIVQKRALIDRKKGNESFNRLTA